MLLQYRRTFISALTMLLAVTWDSETIITPEANYTLSFPRLSKDESGCIYLAYNSQNMTFFDNELFVMRTSFPGQTTSWLPAVSIATSPSSMFMTELAVAGQSLDQKTALVYTIGPSPIEIVANVALGNMWPTEGTWPGCAACGRFDAGFGDDVPGAGCGVCPGWIASTHCLGR